MELDWLPSQKTAKLEYMIQDHKFLLYRYQIRIWCIFFFFSFKALGWKTCFCVKQFFIWMAIYPLNVLLCPPVEFSQIPASDQVFFPSISSDNAANFPLPVLFCKGNILWNFDKVTHRKKINNSDIDIWYLIFVVASPLSAGNPWGTGKCLLNGGCLFNRGSS